jgi:hypothetical protein
VTKREAAIVSAYTGFLIGKFGDMQEYAEGLLGRPLWTHEFGSEELVKLLHELSKPDFVAIEVTE